MQQRSIVLFLITEANDYQELQRTDCLVAARRRGFAVEVFAAENDAEKQLRQIREILRRPSGERPTAILVAPVRESGLLGVAQEAVRLGIGWAALNRSSDYLQELRGAPSTPPPFCVTPDQRQIGLLQGQQFRSLLPEGGELLYICGPLATYSAQKRLEGVRKELDGTQINMVVFNADWSSKGGEQAAGTWLPIFTHHALPPCVVGAQNDEMAMGARKALLEEAAAQAWPELRRILFTGCDGSPRYGQRLVMAGDLAATVVVPPTAGRAVDEIASFFDGGALPLLEVVLPVSPYPDREALTKSPASGRTEPPPRHSRRP